MDLKFIIQSRKMQTIARSEMLNLLSDGVFSTYTNNEPLISDVQPVQVAGPSKIGINRNRA
ncbi:hypothetical protein C2U69_28650 [Cupriavidus pinatubonensis]|nr:hypothetical protein C2U69_28650 [Cupriavidus pinatubonensis]